MPEGVPERPATQWSGPPPATLGQVPFPQAVPAAPAQFIQPGAYALSATSQAALDRILGGGGS